MDPARWSRLGQVARSGCVDRWRVGTMAGKLRCRPKRARSDAPRSRFLITPSFERVLECRVLDETSAPSVERATMVAGARTQTSIYRQEASWLSLYFGT